MIEDNLIGVMVWGAEDSVVRHNVIRGRSDLRTSEAGNGVYVWNAPGARIEDNDITFGQDGIFVTNSRRNVFRNNFLHEVRFAIHYMYTHDSEVSFNRSRGNHSGCALMYSDRLMVRGNVLRAIVTRTYRSTTPITRRLRTTPSSAQKSASSSQRELQRLPPQSVRRL